MRYVISLILMLSVLWLAISGVYKPLLFILGAASVALVTWLSVRMDVVGQEHNPVLYSWRLVRYWSWLVVQIFKSNVHVAKLALTPARIQPQVLTVPVPHHDAVAQVTYANSCTLTPGTVALHLTQNSLLVHALDDASAQDLASGEMARRISWLEGHRAPPAPQHNTPHRESKQ